MIGRTVIYQRKKISLEQLCRKMHISRQAWYKGQKQASGKKMQQTVMVKIVQEIRKKLPRCGGCKLHYMMREDFIDHQIKMGRDNFFKFLKQYDLLVVPRKQYARTTNSNHRFRIYKNLIQEFKPQKPNELWVSDITYLRTLQGFCYLALITDAYSRKIVGYHISDSLELTGCMQALKNALSIPNENIHKQLIHHSDRGIQYCSNAYTALLSKRNIRISMADRGNCYQNALAERVNGILKDEFNLEQTFKTKQQAYEATKQAIKLYNNYRPHASLKNLTPDQKHAA